MKPNREMTSQEFLFSFAIKRMMHDISLIEEDFRQAKTVGMQGDSEAALRNIEGRIFDLRAAGYNALKTVGI